MFTCKKRSPGRSSPLPHFLWGRDCLEGAQGPSVTPGASSRSRAEAAAGREIRWPRRGGTAGAGRLLRPRTPAQGFLGVVTCKASGLPPRAGAPTIRSEAKSHRQGGGALR